MTLDETIKYEEEVAKGYEKKLKVYENINKDRPLLQKKKRNAGFVLMNINSM